MENLNYDLVSDCCGAGCGFETGEGSDRIGICTSCQEWCGVVEDIPEDEADYIPGYDDGEWGTDEDCCGEEDFA